MHWEDRPAKHYNAATYVDRVDSYAPGKQAPAPERPWQISLLDDGLTLRRSHRRGLLPFDGGHYVAGG